MAINGASDPIVRLAIFHRQQPHDHIRPQRNTHLWPTPRHHDRLTNSEAMSRHGGYLGWHRTENNGPLAEPVGSRSGERLPERCSACEGLHTAIVAPCESLSMPTTGIGGHYESSRRTRRFGHYHGWFRAADKASRRHAEGGYGRSDGEPI
jgi:hypothetical protein